MPGYREDVVTELFLIDIAEQKLREAGFLTWLSRPNVAGKSTAEARALLTNHLHELEYILTRK